MLAVSPPKPAGYALMGSANPDQAGYDVFTCVRRLRGRRLTVTYYHLGRGRYCVTLMELRAHGAPTRIGQTTIVVT